MNPHRHSPYQRTSPRPKASTSPLYNYPSPVVSRTITPGSLSDRSTPETTASNDFQYLFDPTIPGSHLSFGLDADLGALGLDIPLDMVNPLFFSTQVRESDESHTGSPLLQAPLPATVGDELVQQESPALTASMLESLRTYSASAPPQAKRNAGPSDDEGTDRSQSELRRQVHIQSEQRRRAQIKDGFEDLRTLVPQCSNSRKTSKAVILTHAVAYIEQLRSSHDALVQEVQRLQRDNEQIRTLLESIAMRQQLSNQMGGKW